MLSFLNLGMMCGQKIFMLGDSHVFAKIYPEQTFEKIQEFYPGCTFDFWGKNGAEFSTYNANPEYLSSLFEFKPDILIVHLGTNDSYMPVFNKFHFQNELETFYRSIKDSLPECKIVLVTPFVNKRWLNKRRTKWKVNTNTRKCSDEMVEFSESHPDCFVIDNNARAGQSFLRNSRLISRDNVHLTEAGYKELGKEVSEDLVTIEQLWKQ